MSAPSTWISQVASVDLLPDDAYNRELINHAHPPDWVNPASIGRYNLVVVGGGTAGLVSALGAAGLGARVALVERHLLGGDCLNFGCVPSKALILAGRASFDARQLAKFGGVPGSPDSLDFPSVMTRMRRLRAGIARHDSARRLADSGVDVFLGSAKFVSRDAVEVDGRRLSFSKAVIATGARAASTSISGLDEAGFLTNETVFSLTELPRRLAVIGAGPIGCELAQAFRRLGSEVILFCSGARVLAKEDSDSAELLQAQFEDEGIELRLSATVQCVSRRNDGRTITFARGRGTEVAVVDEVLVATGRAPNIEGLGVDVAGVVVDKSGVRVDDMLRTDNPNIYAAGDICSAYKFTHAADAMARIVVQNSLFMGRRKASSLVIPWCTYTEPEIAHVGLYEHEAKARGLSVQTLSIPLAEVDRAVLEDEPIGFARIHVDPRDGRIWGGTVVARQAGNMISELALAMTHGLSAGALARTIHPYPTHSDVWRRLGNAYERNRLRPWMKRFFSRYFAWRRRRG